MLGLLPSNPAIAAQSRYNRFPILPAIPLLPVPIAAMAPRVRFTAAMRFTLPPIADTTLTEWSHGAMERSKANARTVLYPVLSRATSHAG